MPRDPWNPKRLQRETGYWRSCVLLTAAHHDLFGWIGNGKKTAFETANHFGGNHRGWEIFLDALCGMGLLRKHTGGYRNTVFAARRLAGAASSSLLPAYDSWRRWGELADRLATGQRPLRPEPFASDRKRTRRLLEALHLDAELIAPHLIEKLSLKKCRSLLDVGGGLGTFSVALCRRYPALRATVVEHPVAATLALRTIRATPLSSRIRVVARDFTRERLPRGYDAVLLSNVIHAHGINTVQSLLREIYRALNPGGRLILRDVFMHRSRTAPEWGALFSVLLLLHTPQGRCYSSDEILRWLRQARFSSFKGPYSSSPLSFDPDSVLIATKH